MDSKDVAKALKADVFPILREAGFTQFKTRTAWRHDQHAIAVVDFRSLGSYIGGALGATSHSVGCVAGLYYRALHSAPWAKDPLPDAPEEWRCQARRVLRKSIFQLWCWRRDVWYVNRKGSNLGSVIQDLRQAAQQQALPWLAELADPKVALEAFESRLETEMRPGIVLEILGGGLNSFARAEAASALALACGERERARAAWQRLLANPYYERLGEYRQIAEDRIAAI